MSESRFCVYSHWANGSVFYVGSGTRRRAFNANSRNSRWLNHIARHGAFSVQFHCWTNNRDKATEIESALIKGWRPSCNANLPGKVHTNGYEPFSVRLSEADMRRVKALASAHDWPIAKVLQKLISAALDARLVK